MTLQIIRISTKKRFFANTATKIPETRVTNVKISEFRLKNLLKVDLKDCLVWKLIMVFMKIQLIALNRMANRTARNPTSNVSFK